MSVGKQTTEDDARPHEREVERSLADGGPEVAVRPEGERRQEVYSDGRFDTRAALDFAQWMRKNGIS